MLSVPAQPLDAASGHRHCRWANHSPSPAEHAAVPWDLHERKRAPNHGARLGQCSEVAMEDKRRVAALLLRDSAGGCGKGVVGIGADQAYGSDH